jgi:hypothetical protein
VTFPVPPSCSWCGGPVFGPHVVGCPSPDIDSAEERLAHLRMYAVRRYRRALFVGVAERAGNLQRVTTFNRLIWSHA